MNQRKNNRGITLVEFLFVITLISILAVSFVYSLGILKAKAKDTVRKHDFQTIAEAIRIYFEDHGKYPLYDLAVQKYEFFLGAVLERTNPERGDHGYFYSLGCQK